MPDLLGSWVFFLMAQALVGKKASKVAKDNKGHTPHDVVCADADFCFKRSALESLLKPTVKKESE